MKFRYKQVAFIHVLLLFVSHYILTVCRPARLLTVLPVRAELVIGYAKDRDCQLIAYEYGVLKL
jgi:hypothetical protein